MAEDDELEHDDAEPEPEPEVPEYGPNVDAALARLDELDERGLMPLASAREWVETSEFGQADADLRWAALLSLEHAAEACEVATRWVWRQMPRGRDNTALVERYGAGVLPWLATRVVEGVLINAPWCVVPCLLALDDIAALELAWSLRGVRDRVEMIAWQVRDAGEQPGDPAVEAAAAVQLIDRWVSAYPETALPWLVGRADEGDARALALLDARARAGGIGFLRALGQVIGEAEALALFERHAWPRTLTREQVLAQLDAATAERWPEFNLAFDGRQEYFALRLIAAREREGEGWGVVFERLTGSYPGNMFVVRYAFGSGVPAGAEYEDIVHLDELDIEGPERDDDHLFHGGVIRGPAGELRLDERQLDAWDLRPGKCTEIGYHPLRALAIRTYLAHAPGCLWPPIDDALAQLGLDEPAPLVVSDAFAHVIGPYQREGVPEGAWQVLPSESPTFRSLAEALVERDASRFDPGSPNTDWRLHAYVDEPVAAAWEFSRVSPASFPGEARGHLLAALAEAAVEPDARGLLPLDEARAIVAAAERFTKGEGRAIGETWVQGSDRLWAALLSLADADEFAAAMTKLAWDQQPRGVDTLAPLDRYGPACVAWLRASVREGVLQIVPRCLQANLLALASEPVVDLLVELEGVAGEAEGEGSPREQLDALRERYFAAHRELVLARLSERASGHAVSHALLREWALLDDEVARALSDATREALGLPRELAADHVLARLDHHAKRPAHELAAWPRFGHGSSPRDEYLGMRVVALRGAGEAWALVFERASGYGHQAALRRYVYGRGVGQPGHRSELDRPLALEFDEQGLVGPCGVLAEHEVDPAGTHLCEPPDYWTGPDGARDQIAALRSYLARWPAAAFGDPAELAAALGLADAQVLVCSDAFEHAEGLPPAPDPTSDPASNPEPHPWQRLPSASASLRSLAEVIATRDPSRFVAGASNLDFRLHTRFAPD